MGLIQSSYFLSFTQRYLIYANKISIDHYARK